MERLREQLSDNDPLVAEAARLSAAVMLSEPPYAMEERIRARLAAQSDRKRLVGWRLHPALAASLLLSFAAVASATAVKRFWPALLEEEQVPIIEPAPIRVPPKTPAVEFLPRALVLPPEFVPEEERASESNSAAPVSTPVSKPVSAQVSAAPKAEQAAESSVQVHISPPPIEPPGVPVPRVYGPEASLVLEATRALHRDRDPKRAIKLLDEYMERYPDGDLREEGLALIFEAYAQRGDDRAIGFADDYLRHFPNGRFRDAARAVRYRFVK